MAKRRSIVALGVAGVAALIALTSGGVTAPNGSDRSISFYHIHTQERLTVTYKRGGQYIPEAMKQLNWILRDWRKNEAITIDPQTIDLAWEMYQELGSREPINIISGYRSPGTNAMLRRTRGGQATKSQHMTGRAIDITFPDVPLKRMRYSALIRERGGVGYYPTSGIPFVHIDTARVRAWPRVPRQELALLFPSGHTQHQPATGGSITLSDVRAAQASNRELATQLASFHADRRNGRSSATIQVAANTPQPTRQLSLTWEKLGGGDDDEAPAERKVVAAFAPASLSVTKQPPLVAPPKLVDRPSKLTPPANAVAKAQTATKPAAGFALASLGASLPSKADRNKLDGLIKQASLAPDLPKLTQAPKPAVRPQTALAEVAARVAAYAGETLPKTSAEPPRQVAALTPQPSSNSITDMSPDSLGNGWVQAPEFDEDHPEELAYRPFPLAPLLTDTPSAHDPQLSGLQHPDVAATLEMIDDEGAIAPMKFRPGRQVAQVMWAQQFEGSAVHLDALKEIDANQIASGIGNRTVKTTSR